MKNPIHPITLQILIQTIQRRSRALGGDRVRAARRADPCAAQQARGRQPASTRPAAAQRQG